MHKKSRFAMVGRRMKRDFEGLVYGIGELTEAMLEVGIQCAVWPVQTAGYLGEPLGNAINEAYHRCAPQEEVNTDEIELNSEI